MTTPGKPNGVQIAVLIKENLHHMQEATAKAVTSGSTQMETAFQESMEQTKGLNGTAPDSDKKARNAHDSVGDETPVLPDGGWGWVVCLTTTLTYGTISGIINGLSLIYVIMLKEFSKGDMSIAFETSWVATLVLAMAFILSPVAGLLCDRFGIRQVALAGGFLIFVGILSSAFVKELMLLYFTFGILVGAGCAFSMVSSVVVLGHYFDKRLGLANAAMMCGGGLMSIGYIWMLPLIYDWVGLRNQLLCLSGLSFLQMVYALTWNTKVHRKRGFGQEEVTTQENSERHAPKNVADHHICVEDCGETGQPTIRRRSSSGQQDTTGGRSSGHARRDNYGRSCCGETDGRGLFNVRIWKNRRYLLWIISVCIGSFGYYTGPIHIVNFADDTFPDSENQLLPVCWSAGLVAARLLLIPLADRHFVQRHYLQLQQAVFFVIGISTICLPLVRAPAWLFVVSAVLGMCDGVFFSLTGPIAVSIVGVQDSSQAVGFYFGLIGLPLSTGPSIAGLWYDYLGSYTLVFHVFGVPLLVGGVLMFLLPFVAPTEIVSPSNEDTHSVTVTTANGVASEVRGKQIQPDPGARTPQHVDTSQ